MNAATIRQQETLRRLAMLGQHRDDARTRRGNRINAALACLIVAAVATCGWYANRLPHPSPGAVPEASYAAPGTSEIDPAVKWRREDTKRGQRAGSVSRNVAPRRGSAGPAPGLIIR